MKQTYFPPHYFQSKDNEVIKIHYIYSNNRSLFILNKTLLFKSILNHIIYQTFDQTSFIIYNINPQIINLSIPIVITTKFYVKIV